jgi:hypothetical protein
MVLLMYLPNMWKDKYDYERTVVDVNLYYETSPYEAKKNQQDPKRGWYKSVSHGYSAHSGEKSQGNIVMYHHDDMSESKQISFRGMGDSIASSIWRHLDKFGSEIKKFFEDQFYLMKCIPIGLEGYTTQVHQLHISKNSYIKLHIDMSDLDASFISRFTKGHLSGGCFAMFQHCLKFNNNSGAGIFVMSKFITHGTLKFNLDSLSQSNFKLGVALVNKGWLRTRLQNQLREGISQTWKNNYWYISEY